LKWIRWCCYLWAGPNTLLGITIGLLLGGRFRWVQGVLEIHGPQIAKIFAHMPHRPAAMTLGHVVLGRDPHCLDLTRRHERVHVAQYSVWGPFFVPMYIAESLWRYAQGQDGYLQNHFEVQAYRIDNESTDTPASSQNLDPN
jgi:hypothetical protein